MNIFVLDKDPKIAATYHCDSHVRKLILESVQMMMTNYRLYLSNTWGIENELYLKFNSHPILIGVPTKTTLVLYGLDSLFRIFSGYYLMQNV